MARKNYKLLTYKDRKKLEEIGIHNEFEKELKIMRYDAPLKLLYTNNDA